MCAHNLECELLNWQSRKDFFRSINNIRPFKQHLRNNSCQNHRNMSISEFLITVREHPGVVDVTDWLQVDGQLSNYHYIYLELFHVILCNLMLYYTPYNTIYCYVMFSYLILHLLPLNDIPYLYAHLQV